MSIPISNSPPDGITGTSFGAVEAPPVHIEPLFSQSLTQDTSIPLPALNEIIKIPGGKTIVLSDAPITIGQFSDAVSLSINSSKQMINLGNLTDLIANKNISVSQGDLAEALLAIRAQINLLQAEETTLFSTQNSQIDTENTAISTLNTAVASTQLTDQIQIAAMNQAIQDYNNGSITNAQFNAAAAVYNAYAASRNGALAPFIANYSSATNTFQQDVDQNNQVINTLNPLLTSYDIPTLPNQTGTPPNPPTPVLLSIQPLAPLATPVPLLPIPQTLPLLQNIAPPPLNPIDFLTNFYQPMSQAIIQLLSLSNRQINLQRAYIDFLLFFLPGKKINEAPALMKNVPEIFLGASADRGSGGVALASISPLFDGPAINGILANNILVSDQKQFQLQFTSEPLNPLFIFASQLSAFGGLQASVEGLRLLGTDELTNSRSSIAFGIAFGLSNAQIISQEISSGKIKNLIQQTLIQELGNQANPQTIANATEFINANINLFLLQSALFNSSVALGTPGLVGQIFGNVNLIPSPPPGTAQQTFFQAVQDTLKQLFLKRTLAVQLAENQALKNQAAADQLINEAVNSILAEGQAQNAENFKKALIKKLEAANIANETAVTTANLAAALIEEERKSQSILNEDLLNKEKVHDILASQISEQAQISDEKAQNIAQEAIRLAFANNLISNTAEFKIALQNQLTLAGINESAASKALSNVIAALNIPNPIASPLLNPLAPTSVLSPLDLGNALFGLVQGRLTALEETKAREIASQSVAAFIDTSGRPGSPPSLLSLIDENVKTLERLGGRQGVDLVAESFRNYLSPSIDLLSFSQNILDPAYNLFFSAGTGVMYANKPHPSNFKQEIDIKV